MDLSTQPERSSAEAEPWGDRNDHPAGKRIAIVIETQGLSEYARIYLRMS
jgi:hypothetical protein